MQKKYYLLAPGPTPVPPKVLAAMSEPIIHHRAPAFVRVLGEVREGLKYLFQTKQEVLLFSSSGTGAMEGAVTNTLCRGDQALVVRGGKFGERWAEICDAYGVETTCIDVPWGQSVNPRAVESALTNDSAIRAVFTQASETSTGVVHPITCRGLAGLLLAALPKETLERLGYILLTAGCDDLEDGIPRLIEAFQLLQQADQPGLDDYVDEPIVSVNPTASARTPARLFTGHAASAGPRTR